MSDESGATSGASATPPSISLHECTVTNADGYTSTMDNSKEVLKGTIVHVDKNPYMFYAAENPSGSTAVLRKVHQVKMIMPLGGTESGLFRFPKIGEKVLVASNANKYYLMGYVPSIENPFSELVLDSESSELKENTQGIFDEQGEVLRYRNTAVGSGSPYSEIGFYHKPKAEWPLTRGGAEFPPIDLINIESSGNIRESAVNHHLQKAKRMEILADCPEVLDRGTCAVDSQGTLPLGDFPGDDSALHAGDIHIRAGNRVIIKADQEIRLQVGRTTLRMDDAGFNVTTKNVSGNFVNSHDTMLNMNPRSGIVMNGKNINVQAGYRLNMGDGMGGSFAAGMGTVSINGREINIDSCNNVEYLFYTIYQGLEYLANATSASMAFAKDEHIEVADYMKFTVDNLKSLVQMAKKVFTIWGKRKEIIAEKLKEKQAADEALYVAAMNAYLEKQKKVDPFESLPKDEFIARYGKDVYDALVAYSTNDGYTKMNEYLRGLSTADQIDPKYLAQVKLLQTYFHGQETTQDATVYRYFNVTPDLLALGVSESPNPNPPPNNFVTNIGTLAGQHIDNAAFMSTSTEDQTSGVFAQRGNTLLILDVPKGTPGINIAGISKYPGEKEFLLSPGVKYRITRAEINNVTQKMEIHAVVV